MHKNRTNSLRGGNNVPIYEYDGNYGIKVILLLEQRRGQRGRRGRALRALSESSRVKAISLYPFPVNPATRKERQRGTEMNHGKTARKVCESSGGKIVRMRKSFKMYWSATAFLLAHVTRVRIKLPY